MCVCGCIHTLEKHNRYFKYLSGLNFQNCVWGKQKDHLTCGVQSSFNPFSRAWRHLSSITGCHRGYVVASSPSALMHSETCWELKVTTLPKRGSGGDRKAEKRSLNPLTPRANSERVRYSSCVISQYGISGCCQSELRNSPSLVKIQTPNVKLAGARLAVSPK